MPLSPRRPPRPILLKSLLLHHACAESLPFKNGVFAGAICTFAHHHVQDPVAAFGEIRRVLRPRSRLVLLNSTLEQTRHYWLAEYFPKAMAQAAAPYERVETDRALEAANLRVVATEPYNVTDDLRDWFLLC